MYDKVVSNVKMNQEKSADPYTMDANAEPYNSNECDGLINSHENLCKNKAGKDNLTESREPTNKKQNTAANRGKSWRVCVNTSLICMIVCILAGSIEYKLMRKYLESQMYICGYYGRMR